MHERDVCAKSVLLFLLHTSHFPLISNSSNGGWADSVGGFVCIEGAESFMFLFPWSHAKHQACALRRCFRQNLGMFVLKGQSTVKRTVSFVMQFNILCCRGLRTRGLRRNRDGEGCRHQPWTPVRWECSHSLTSLLSRFAFWQQLALVIIVEITLK